MAGTRILVCGGRDYNKGSVIDRVLSNLWLNEGGFDVIIEGGAKGADYGARLWGQIHRIPVETYYAEWGKHDRSAGPIRNKRMLDEGKPDLVIAFPGGAGTADMIKQAKLAGVKVIEIGTEEA